MREMERQIALPASESACCGYKVEPDANVASVPLDLELRNIAFLHKPNIRPGRKFTFGYDFARTYIAGLQRP